MSYVVTKSRVFQYIGIILILAVFAGAYWYFKVYGSTLNAPRNDLNTNGLVGLWSFNGDDISGTTAYDRSGSGNNGTLANGPAVTQGKVGQALDFDGTNDYVSTADYSYSNAQAFTMSVWFKADTVSGNQVIFSKETYEYNLRLTDATLAFAYWDTGGVGAIDLSYSNVAANRWYLVGVTYDGSGAAYMYVDGVRVASDTNIVNTFQNKAEALRIGGGYHISGNPGYLNGQIDEMRIYNRALSAGEIQSLYAAGGGTKIDSAISQPQGTGRLDSGLAGYWALDDGSGTSATDSSTNSYTGTLTNGPTWTTGQIGSAVAFDGTDDYIDTNNGSALDSMSEYSYAAWIYPTSADGFIIAKASNGGGSSGFRLTSSTLQGWRANFSNWTAARSTSSTTVSLNTWSHVVMTYSHTGDKKHHIYLNGVEVAYSEQDTNGFGLDSDPSYDFWIGRKEGVNEMADVPFAGNIDEARIYNRPLSVSEISQLSRLTAPTSTDTGLKGYWSFNGKDMSSTSAYDRSGAGNTGTLTNGPAVTQGKVGQALSFDGSDDYVNIADSAALSPSTAMTVSFWTKVTGSVSSQCRSFIAKNASGSRSWVINATTSGGVNFYVASDANDSGGNYGATGSGFIVQNQWAYVTTVFDGSQSGNVNRAKVYINGIQQNLTFTGTIGASLTDTAQAVRFGEAALTCTALPGMLDEVRIYNRALSAAEIQAQYAAGQSDEVNTGASQAQGTGRLDSGLAGYWKLDDGSGTSATDSSTNANTGTLTNGPTWTTGQIGGAVSFDGNNDKVALTDNAVFDVAGAGSWCNWFYSTANQSARGMFSHNNSGSDYVVISGYLSTNSATLSSYVRVGGTAYSAVTPTYATGYWDNQWHFVCTTFDRVLSSQRLKVYADGVLIGTHNAANGDVDTGNSPMVGAWRFSNTDQSSFLGYIDEVRMYNRALSADEVAQLYRLNAPTGTDTGLKGYWSFNGKDMSGTTAYDRSGAGNTGTLTSGPAITEGKLGQGLSFDGTDDYVTTTNATTTYQYPNTTFTVSGWFKKTSTSNGYLVTQGGCYGGWGIYLLSGTVRVRLKSTGSCGGDSAQRDSSTTTLNDGAWHHFAAIVTTNTTVSASNDISIYIDGALNQGSVSRNGNPYGTTAADLAFGVSSYGGGYFNGSLDEVRIYNRALTEAEIKSLYNTSR